MNPYSNQEHRSLHNSVPVNKLMSMRVIPLSKARKVRKVRKARNSPKKVSKGCGCKSKRVVVKRYRRKCPTKTVVRRRPKKAKKRVVRKKRVIRKKRKTPKRRVKRRKTPKRVSRRPSQPPVNQVVNLKF